MSPLAPISRPRFLGFAPIWVCILIGTLALTIGCAAAELETGPTGPASQRITGPVPGFTAVPVAATGPDEGPTIASPGRPPGTPTQIPTPLAEPIPTSTPPFFSRLDPTRSPTIGPSPQVEPISLSLDLLAPTEGTGVDVGAVRVLGVTSPNAAVSVNGIDADVKTDGTFQQDLILREGINSIEALATQPSGAVASDSVVVLFMPRATGIPLSVLFPQGVEVSDPEIIIIGATRQDAVVGVNGIPVEVNSLGIFSTEVTLELGANLVEVVAVDLAENVNFQTVVVFYIPSEGPIFFERD